MPAEDFFYSLLGDLCQGKARVCGNGYRTSILAQTWLKDKL